MNDLILLVSLELGYGVLTIIILLITLKNWITDRNIIDFALFFVLLISALESLYMSYTRMMKILYDIDIDLLFNQTLIHSAITLSAGAIYFWFLLYLQGWKRFYTFPFISALFFGVYSAQTGEWLISALYVLLIVGVSGLYLFYISVKNKKGLLFSISITIILYIGNDIVGANSVTYYILQYLSSITLLLGVLGWFDRHLFYDREYIKEISNTWVGNRIMIKKKPKNKKFIHKKN